MAVSLGNAHGWPLNNEDNGSRHVAQAPASAPAPPPSTPASGPSQLEAREGPAPAQWQAVREEIRILYEKRPLRDVRRILEQRHGFRATERMYKARLSQWGISKNYSDKDYQICAVLHHLRQDNGKRSTAFVIHRHKRSLRDLHKYIKGRKMTEDEFLAVALKNIHCTSNDGPGQMQYAHVRAYTPEPETEGDGDGDDEQPPLSESSVSPQLAPAKGQMAPWSTKGAAVTELVPTVSDLSGSGSRQPPTVDQDASSVHQIQSATQLTPATPQTAVGQFAPEESFITWNSPDSSTPSSRTHLLSSPLELTTSAYSSSTHPASNALQCSSVEDPNLPGHAGPIQDRSSPAMSCQQLGRDVEYMALQMVDAHPLRSLCGRDDIQTWRLLNDTSSVDSQDYEHVCPTCHDLTKDHFVSLPNLEITQLHSRSILNSTHDVAGSSSAAIAVPASSRDHEHSWKWVARCFAACIYMSRGNDTLSRVSLEDAEAEFEKMLVPEQDPKALLALNHTLAILQMHNQGAITQDIMAAANRVAERVLGPNEPLTVITRWMVFVSNGQMLRCEITSTTLLGVHEEFVHRHGLEDLRSIASLYCYGYMLNVERKLELAEQMLRETYARSTAILGPAHLQSISALTNLHRCLDRQGRVDEAIAVLKQAIDDSRDTLGESHPRRLESMRLLGLLYQQQDRPDLTEECYWPVLEGRVKMLGRNHAYSQGIKRDMEILLTQLGKWWIERPPQIQQQNRKESSTSMSRTANSHAEPSDPEVAPSREQLRIHDLFEWDPDDKWDDSHSADGSDTCSQTEAF